MNDVAVELRRSALLNLAKLVIARAETPTGLMPLHRRDAHRLRSALDAELGRGFGKAFILRGDGQEYRVAILQDAIPSQVRVGTPFRELTGMGAVPRTIMKSLSRILGGANLRETGKRQKKR